MTAETADTNEVPQPDLSVILPPGAPIVLDGIECSIRPMKAREFMLLMGVITDGLGPALSSIRLEGMDQDAVSGLMFSALIMALPNAAPRFFSFIQAMVVPDDTRKTQQLQQYLQNPETDDLLPIIDRIMENEAENITALVGKARQYIQRWQSLTKKQKANAPQ